MIKPLMDAHDIAKAQFGKLAEARTILDRARVELTNLAKLGDMVTPEDVIKGAGKLVGAGMSPMALAKLMSDMPDQGPQLQAWLQTHATQLAAREAQLEPVLSHARHQLGVTALRALAAHSLMPQMPQQAPQSNPLMPSQTVIEPSTPTQGNA